MAKNKFEINKYNFMMKASGLLILTLILTFIVTNLIKHEISNSFEKQSIKEQTRLLNKIIEMNKVELNELTNSWLEGNTYKRLRKENFNKEQWEGSLLGLANATNIEFGSLYFVTHKLDGQIINHYNTAEKQDKFDTSNKEYRKLLKAVAKEEFTGSKFIKDNNEDIFQVFSYPIYDDFFTPTNIFTIVTNLDPIIYRFKDITGLDIELNLKKKKTQKILNKSYRKISSSHLEKLSDGLYFKVFLKNENLQHDLNLLTNRITLLLGSIFVIFSILYYRISKKVIIQKANSLEYSRLSSLGEMAGSIAHEINNPLTVIQGHAIRLKSLARKEKLNKDVVFQSTDGINEVVIRITKIIQSLKNLARNDEDSPFKLVKTTDIITDAITLSEQKFKRNGIELKNENKASSCLVNCRRVEISRILVNLLNNAFDAVMESNSKDKRITVQVKKVGDTIYFNVIDSGEGISPAIIEKIMDPFFTTKAVGVGTGLGLSMSQKIAKEHQGELLVVSKPGRTEFSLILPCAAS